MKTVLQIVVSALFVSCVAISGIGILLGVFEIFHYDRVYPGVSVWGEELGGMTRSESVEILSRKLSFLQSESITLRDGGNVWIFTPGQLGVKVDLEDAVQNAFRHGRTGNIREDLWSQWAAAYSGFSIAPLIIFNQAQAEQLLVGIASGINVTPEEASITVDGGSVTLSSGQNGRSVDVRATADQLALPLEKFSGVDMQLVVNEIRAMVVDADKESLIAQRIISNPLELLVDSPREEDPSSWILDRASLAEMLVISEVDGKSGKSRHRVGLDQERLRKFLEYAAAQLYVPPANARFSFDESRGEFDLIKASVLGRAVNVERTIQEINTELLSGRNLVSFHFDDIHPQVGDDVRAVDMDISKRVASATTFFQGSGAARINNIIAGSATIQGVLVPPGEVFSFNGFLGDVSLDTGFSEAWIIYGGRTIQGVGGGICQVSTTVFRAAFLGGYPILERNPHAYRVGYYEQGPDSPGPGLDATVFRPLADFRFRNDRDAWLLISVEVDENIGTVTFDFYSKEDGRTVTIEGPMISSLTQPEPALYEENPELETGVIEQIDWAADGAVVSVRRVVERDATLLLDEEIITTYQPWQAIYQYGPGTELPQDVYTKGETEG